MPAESYRSNTEGETMEIRTMGKAVLTAVFGTALMLISLPGISTGAEPGGASGMKMEEHGGTPAKSDGQNVDMGENIFSGKVGPWTAEVRLIDMKAQMVKAGDAC